MSTNPRPSWLLEADCVDDEVGVLRSGKEAQIDVVERRNGSGERCLLARKRYLPRQVESKGQLEALGVQRASTFRNDAEYREGRQFRKTRDRRAIERMTAYGKRLLQSRWTNHEHDVMTVLWDAGMSVPYPVSYADDLFTLQYLGDRDGAAPQLIGARLGADQLGDVITQFVDGLHQMVAAGWVHGDLSPYNLLWWQGRLWFIDFPQAVDLAANPQGVDYLHRDVLNVCRWFERRGAEVDAEAIFADVLGSISSW